MLTWCTSGGWGRSLNNSHMLLRNSALEWATGSISNQVSNIWIDQALAFVIKPRQSYCNSSQQVEEGEQSEPVDEDKFAGTQNGTPARLIGRAAVDPPLAVIYIVT